MPSIRQISAGKKIAVLKQLPYSLDITGGTRGVMVIVVGNGHGDTSSNPGRD